MQQVGYDCLKDMQDHCLNQKVALASVYWYTQSFIFITNRRFSLSRHSLSPTSASSRTSPSGVVTSTPASMIPPIHFSAAVYSASQEYGEVSTSRPLGSRNSATESRNAVGSGRRSIRLPPKMRLNLPRDLSRLQASPTTKRTFPLSCECCSCRTVFEASMKALEKSMPTASEKCWASSMVLLPTAHPKSSARPCSPCFLASAMQISAQALGKLSMPKKEGPQWKARYVSTMPFPSQGLRLVCFPSSSCFSSASRCRSYCSVSGWPSLRWKVQISWQRISSLRAVMWRRFCRLWQERTVQKAWMTCFSKRAKKRNSRGSAILPGTIIVNSSECSVASSCSIRFSSAVMMGF